MVEGGVPSDRISVVYDGVPLLAQSSLGQRILVPRTDDPRKGTAIALEAARLAGVDARLSEDLTTDLRFAGMLVYVTFSEGLGSAALLAMSAGVPVVASSVGGLPEAVGAAGLLVANDPAPIAAAILRLHTDSELTARLGEEGRRRVQEMFTVEKMIANTLEVYASC
jgi:hypothetical protein